MSLPKDYKSEWRDAGLCTQGCKRALHSKWYCIECLTRLTVKVRASQTKNLDLGKCRNGCERELATKNHCRPCADRNSKQTMARVARKAQQVSDAS